MADPAAKPSKAQRFSDELALYSKIAAMLLAAATAAAVSLYFIYLVIVAEPGYRIQGISVPKPLADSGISENVARNMLAANLSLVQDRSNTIISNRFVTDKPMIDFSVPKTSFTFQTLVDWAKDALKRHNTSVSLDITQLDNQWEFRATVVDRYGHTNHLPMRGGGSIDKLMLQTSIDILQNIDVLVSGAYKLDVAQQRCRSTGTCIPMAFQDALQDLLAATHDRRLATYRRAFASIAHMYAISGDHPQAKQILDLAIKRVESEGPAFDLHLMRGIELTDMNEHTAAAADYTYVIAHADSTVPWSCGCNVLQSYAYEDLAKDRVRQPEADVVAKYKAAIPQYEASLKFCRANETAEIELAYAFYMSNDESHSVAILQRVLSNDPSNALAHKDLGNSLRELDLKKYQEAQHRDISDCGVLADAIAELRNAATWARVQRSMTVVADASLDLGKTFEKCGNSTSALLALNDSLDAKPGYDLAIHEMDDFLQSWRDPAGFPL